MHDDVTKTFHAREASQHISAGLSSEDLAPLPEDVTAACEAGQNGAHKRHTVLAPHHYKMLTDESGIAAAVIAARAAKYRNAGTIEFLVEGSGDAPASATTSFRPPPEPGTRAGGVT